MPEPAQPVDKAAVVAYAEHHGPAKTALVFGVPVGSVKGWLGKHRAKVKERDISASVSVSVPISGTEGEQREDSNGRQVASQSAPRARVKGTAEEYLGKVRGNLHRLMDTIERMKITDRNAHQIATALAKGEIAGRVPFGYGGDNSGQAAFGLLNVYVHNARHDSMPALAHDVQAEVMPLLAVSTETDSTEEDESCK